MRWRKRAIAMASDRTETFVNRRASGMLAEQSCYEYEAT
jgi:hypothetical protein